MQFPDGVKQVLNGRGYLSCSVCCASFGTSAACCLPSSLPRCTPGMFSLLLTRTPYVFSRATTLSLSLLQVLLEGVRCIILYLSLLNFMRYLLARISAYWLHPQLVIIHRHFVPSSNDWVCACMWLVCQLLLFLLQCLHFILGGLFSSNACKLEESGIISSATDKGLFYIYDVCICLSLLKSILARSMDFRFWNLGRNQIIYYDLLIITFIGKLLRWNWNILM